MSSREPIIVANWKMHKGCREAEEFIGLLTPHVPREGVRVWIAPSATALRCCVRASENTPVWMGAQNVHTDTHGPFTGEVSASQVAECGARFVLVGHSERRRWFGETVEQMIVKLRRIVDAGMVPLVCVGESAEDRAQGRAQVMVERDLSAILCAFPEFSGVIAYEPVWAIGTGKVATPEIIGEMHAVCRSVLQAVCHGGHKVPILYGGSVNRDNGLLLRGIENVDGILVGNASLEVTSFLELIKIFEVA